MRLFLVHLITPEGKKKWSFQESATISELFLNFSKHSMVPLNVKEVPRVMRFLVKLFSAKITKMEIIELLSNLHIVVRGGLPLYQGLEDIASESSNTAMKSMLQNINNKIRSGLALSKAIEPYERHFGRVVINLTRIGEDTGDLEHTLEKGAFFLKRSYELRKKVTGALIYPALVASIVLSAVLVWIIFVLPMLAELFAQKDLALPPWTQLLLNISLWVQLYYKDFFILLLLSVLSGIVTYKRSEKVSAAINHLVMRMPLIGEVIRLYNNAYITEYLHLALSSGIPLYNAVESVSSNIVNRDYRNSLLKVKQSLFEGEQLSVALHNAQLFTPFTVRMLQIGEKSGNIEDQLKTISKYYYEKVDDFAQNISKIIEPAVIIFIGGFFALIMVALMGPIMDIVVEVI